MKDKNNIDDLFKAGITGYRMEPSEQVWKNIESGFFGNERGGFYKWYYLGAAAFLLLLIIGGILYFNKVGVNDELRHNEIVRHSNNEPFTIDETQPEDNTVAIATDSGNLNIRVEDAEQEVETQTPAQNIEINNDEIITDENNLEPVSFESTRHNTIQSEYYPIEPNPFENANFRVPLSLSILTLDSRTIDNVDSPNANMIDPEKVTGLQNYLDKQKKSHFYTGATFMAGMMYYPSTKDQFIWIAELEFGLTAGKFYFETGIGYQDIKERGIYSIELKSYDSVGYYNKVESFEIDPQHPEEIIYNTNKVTVYDSLDHYTHSTPYFKYKYINLPLSIGFKFFHKEKFTVSVNTGLVFSWLVDKNIPEESYYDPDYTVVRINNMTPDRVDWNMQWQIGIRFNYRIYKSLSIIAEPVFSKYINSIYDTEKGYNDVKPYSMGLRVGIYYGF